MNCQQNILPQGIIYPKLNLDIPQRKHCIDFLRFRCFFGVI